MSKNSNKSISQEATLYNNILLLSRNKLFYTKFNLIDSFQNRIHLIFFHISFIFIKIRQESQNNIYKEFHQKMFDLIFDKIEINMREIGYGDVSVNKNMKFLVKNFYSLLLKCEKYKKMDNKTKDLFFNNFLDIKTNKNSNNYMLIIDYFNKYEAFCFDLDHDSVLQGDLNFNFK